MNKRHLLRLAAGLPFLGGALAGGGPSDAKAKPPFRSRVRPGDPAWPSDAAWETLDQAVGGRLSRLRSPFSDCGSPPAEAACAEAKKHLANPFYIGDEPALTQTSGWFDAWASRPSAYVVAAESAADVVAAVNFAREHRLRLVIKGGGHSYQGTSCAPDSLLIWTHRMNSATLHDAFVAQGCEGFAAPQPAVTLGAGALWADAYDAVTTRGGRYVQGGGCMTVGVAGLVQSGGFNMFSKAYGTAAAGLIEAEVVTADGAVRIANARTNPDLFWGLKGGGGGSLGVVTRVTLRTRELPETFGLVGCSIQAASDAAYRALIARTLAFYRDHLCNPHWGEQITLRTRNALNINMLFQGLTLAEAEALWAPFFAWVKAQPEYSFRDAVRIFTLPARGLWDRAYMHSHFPGALEPDDRPAAPPHHVRFADDDGEVGWFIHAYQSAWLPAALIDPARQAALADALFACTRHASVQLFCSKGLAGAPASEIAAARDTATNPQVLDAFTLAILSAAGPPAYQGLSGEGPDLAAARQDAERIRAGMAELHKLAPGAGSYVSESDYFLQDWQTAFWGSNYQRLLAVKTRYDPEGLFFVHHGVGSEAWSADGFERL